MITVDIPSIERELRQLWKDNAAGAAGGAAVTRALTINLAARARDRATGRLVSDVALRLMGSHPNRTILALVDDEEAEPRLEAYVQANCLLTAPGVPQVCGEQITIDAGGVAAAQVASLVLPLLVPDLPVALWLPGPDPFGDPLLGRLRGVVDRLIVDSREFVTPARDLAAMAVFERAAHPGLGAGSRSPALSDLSWAALTPWRELTAQFFDARPLLPHLRRIDQVEIGYVPVGGSLNPIQALLLAGWLASCLGWTPLEEAVSLEGDTLRLHVRRPAVGLGPSAIRLVMIDIRPEVARDGGGPGIAGLRLRAIDGATADFRVERADVPGHAVTAATVAGHPPISRMARCEEPGLADLVAAELRLLSRDSTFASALRTAAAFAGRLP